MSQNVHPITKGHVRVPVIIQLEALECGAASLAMILAYYKKWVPLEQVRIDCGVSRDGSKAVNILKAARHYGLETKAYKFETETLRKNATFPCIVHWNFNHFIVLNGFKGNKVYINDPGRGACVIPIEEFDKAFTGVCLMFTPGENFEPSGHKRNALSFAAKRLKGSKSAVILALITGLITTLLGIVDPAFSRIFIDRLLGGKNPEWLGPFLAVLVIFNIVQIAASAIAIIYRYRIEGKMAAVGSSSYMWKILNLPMLFYSQRMAGDIIQRQTSNAQITNTIINTFTPLIIQTASMFFYLYVMIRYNLFLTFVGICAMTLSTVVSQIIARKRADITKVSLRDSAKLSSATLSGINMVETIKAAGAENGYFSKWAGYQASVNYQTVKTQKISLYLGMIPQFLTQLANDAVLIIGVFLTMQGEFTVGMVMAFQGFLVSFMEPAMMLSSAGQALQEMTTEIERVDDVMNYPVDNVFAKDGKEEHPEKLHGNIEIKNLYFGYSPLSDPLIKDFNLSVKAGESIAIVGSSGCGKSTISKLVSGLVKPWSGEILFDGKPMNEIESRVFHSSVGVVDQDIILFEDTIANNIKMWDDSIEDFEMILAARDAQLHDSIMQRPRGYQHRLHENGKDFSGGQRQRMEIARVLAQDPTVVIMDEATSALDAKTEYELVKAVRMRGITSIVIAHRLSTIRSCDRIIVLNNGVITDQGTHDELIKTSEHYRSLVMAE